MSCQFCGALIDRGVVACPVCGGIQPEPSSKPRAVATASRPDPAQVVLAGPPCAVHPGTPVLGQCPRCKKDVCVRCAPGAVVDDLTCSDCAGLTEKYRSPPPGALCAVHPSAKAAFICARCGAFACNACRPLQDSSGRCARCAPEGLPLASRSSRFWANLIDSFAVAVPAIVAMVIAGLSVEGVGRSEAGTAVALVLGGVGLGLLLGFGLELVAQLTWGQSVGKRALNIKVVRSDGSPIELWRLIILRNLVIHVLSQACGLVGLVDALLIFGEQRKCLHDYLADSIVVQA